MRKKIIATGISGLVGSRITEILGDKFQFISFSLDSGVDITDFNLLKLKLARFSDAKTVLHLAAFTDVTAAFKQNGDKNGSCYKVNVVGSRNIAQLCRNYKKYLIHISTDFVFGDKNPPAGGYIETDEPKPLKDEWYGKTKYLAEQEVEKSGCDFTILRIAFPYKAKPALKKLEPEVKLDLPRRIKEKLEKGMKLNMFTDQVITPTFIDDIAKVVGKCISKRPQGIFHCVGSENLSPYNLACKIADTFDLNKSLIKKAKLEDFLKQNPGSRPRQKNLSLSNDKVQKELGIKMLTVDEALEIIKTQL